MASLRFPFLPQACAVLYWTHSTLPAFVLDAFSARADATPFSAVLCSASTKMEGCGGTERGSVEYEKLRSHELKHIALDEPKYALQDNHEAYFV